MSRQRGNAVLWGSDSVPIPARRMAACSARGVNVHELSLANEICRIAEANAGAAGPAAVRAVAVEVGDDAGVELESLTFCLEALLSQPPFGQAAPRILRRTGDVLRVSYLEVDDGGTDD